MVKKAFNRIKVAIIHAMIPVILLIVAAALVVGIIEAVADAVNEAISSIGEAPEATVDENDGKIEIDVNHVDTIINSIYESGVDPSDMGLMGELDNKGFATSDEYREALRKYIREFYEAQVVTETLNYKHLESTDSATYGSVYVYRATGDNANTNRRALTYIPYEQMLAYQTNHDPNAKNYFSIDEDGKLVIAGTVQTIVETGSSKSSLSEQSNEYEVTLRSIDYKTAISQYTTKLTFLIDLVLTSQNPEFVSALVDLIKDSRIEITIMDNVTNK